MHLWTSAPSSRRQAAGSRRNAIAASASISAAARRTCSWLKPPEGFRYVSGTPKTFARSDLDAPVAREFCPNCGTHLTTRRPGLPFVILKVGTLDDPSLYGGPKMAIYTIDKQPFHLIPEGVPTFERLPRR